MLSIDKSENSAFAYINDKPNEQRTDTYLVR